MSYRFMRMLLSFDLPMVEPEDRREYTRFRKYLIRSGFMMIHESLYAKLALNSTAVKAMTENLRRSRPAKGSVILLTITEKQFSGAEYLVGEHVSEVIDTTDRLVIL